MEPSLLTFFCEDVRAAVEQRAVEHGRSPEDEIRKIVSDAVETSSTGQQHKGLGTRISELFKDGGVQPGEIVEFRGQAAHPAEFDR